MIDERATPIEKQSLGGFAAVLSHIEAKFLHEAARVMSGSKAMADILSNIQALIALATPKPRNR